MTHTPTEPRSSKRLFPSWLSALLRVRLLWKLIIGNAVFLTVSLLVWEGVHLNPGDSGEIPFGGLAALLLLVSGLLNAAVVTLALRPIASLEATATRVFAGDWSARAPASPLADEPTERLRVLLNRILDDAESRRAADLLLSRAAFRVEERERGRISDAMYQETAQSLATLLLQLRTLEKRAPIDTGDQGPGPVAETVRTVLEEIRSLARRLRPPELDELGLRSALTAFVRRLRAETPGAPEVRILGEVPEARLDPEVRLVLYRVLQEALENAVRHAGASGIELVVHEEEGAVVARVRDDGRGFEPARHLRADTEAAGLGILSMFERVRVVRGLLTVDSTPGRGTEVALRVPVSDPPPLPSPDATREPAADRPLATTFH